MLKYIKHAFLFRWNMLFFLGGAAFAAMSGHGDALLPILSGVELAYLVGLSSIPRFRTAIDAKLAAEGRGAVYEATGPAQVSLQRMLEALPPLSLRRFLLLRQRCFEMRDIASGVQGKMAGASSSDADSIRTPALDKLLFLFLKLLMSQAGLDRFLKSTSEPELTARLKEVQTRLAAAQTAKDERVTRSLQDSLADAQLRLDNYQKSTKDADFVAVELDRIETKIKALIEMGVSRQDPDLFSTQVTAAAESMAQTEDAVKNLQSLSGLSDQLAEPPAILNADLGKVMVR
ncbi:MAG TPA: hypothetical protein VE967_04090 [Gemmatimonadaceae bacterium]|nr:hypothetical protein [Gemmatimonadaceae bacterium]